MYFLLLSSWSAAASRFAADTFFILANAAGLAYTLYAVFLRSSLKINACRFDKRFFIYPW